ncbi:MAG: rubrerythrin [Ethanoligenens sp.]|uniref:rubrerythrin n=1 Tax=Ethanoligenens sp. TaxID=2099655 RepID=UPI0039EA6694
MDYSNPYFPSYNAPIVPVALPYSAPVQNQPFDTMFVYPQNVPNALALIAQAVAGEAEDTQFYTWLLQNAPSDEDRQIITGIRNDEMHHNGWFRQLYLELTGRPVPAVQGETFTPPASYCDGLRQAIMGEQDAVRRYRQILFALQNRVHINVVTNIITDELRHAILYNYLYAKNNCTA